MSKAAKLKIYIEAGTDFELDFVFRDSNQVAIDITGCTLDALVAATVNDVALATFTGTVTDGPNGKGKLFLPGSESLKLNTITSGWWQVDLTAADHTVRRIIEGPVTVAPKIKAA